MRQRFVLLIVGLVAGFGLVASSLAHDPPQAEAAPPCVISFPATASSASGAIVCDPCDAAGFLAVVVVGIPGTTGTSTCGTAGVSCTVPVGGTFCANAVAIPAQPPGTLRTCIVTKPAGFGPPFVTWATCF